MVLPVPQQYGNVPWIRSYKAFQEQCFLDDIIVTGVDEETHLANLTAVLARLEKYGLRANKNKCEFFKDAIEYCGHKIDRHGLHKTEDKVEAVLKAPDTKNVSQLRSFLGLINYYHKFLPNLSTVLHPLNSLLQQNVKWKWTKNYEEAFNLVKLSSSLHQRRF